ncbi:MAG: matrixin family metalloprotease [bacterium]|nr:MAG: matrixin family metalloprotease [bacterium]
MSCKLADLGMRCSRVPKVTRWVFLLLLIAPIASLEAYNLWGDDTWDSDPTLRIYTVSFAAGTVWRSDLINGIDRWNDVWGMWLEFDTEFRNDATWRTGDGINGVGFSASADIGGAWGVTYKISDGDEIEEMDVRFNADLAWETGAQDERVREVPAFRKVVVHELGHALGLDHECSELAVMAQGTAGHVWYGGNAPTRHHPMADDVEGSRELYPWSGTYRDVALSNFEMLGTCSSQLWRNNTSLTTVEAGSTVDLEYLVSNPGNVGINFILGIYLSTNDNISKWDTYLTGQSWWMTYEYNSETDITVTIPCDVPPGIYHMGVVADPDYELAEVREGNNRLVFPGRWRVVASTALPDLTVVYFSHKPLEPKTDQTIVFTATVKNIGCGRADASELELRVGGETYGQVYTVPALNAGETHIIQRREQLSVAQNYLNHATADFGNVVAESNEGNNIRTDSYTVVNP